MGERGYVEAAISVLRAITASGLASADVLSELGLLYHVNGQINEAIRCYESALSHSPRLDTIQRLAVLYFAKGRRAEAVSLMQAGVDRYGLDNPLSPQLARMRYVWMRQLDSRALDDQKALFDHIAHVENELEKAPLYQPSEFWQKHIQMHKYLLEAYGIENLKRTVSHNYQNWFMVSAADPQVKRLKELHPECFVASSELDSSDDVTDVGFHFVAHDLQRPNRTRAFNVVDVDQGGAIKTEVLFPEYLLSKPENLRMYKAAVRALWKSSGIDTSPFKTIIFEEEVGNPIRVLHENKRISSDLAHSFRERREIFSAACLDGSEGLCVAELGAGHGRLAELFGKTTNYRYFIFDIAPALCVSQWYISRLFGEQNVFTFRPFTSFDDVRDELSAARFAFFSANQIELFPDNYFNMFININSLMEMRLDQIKNFLFHIDRLTTDVFYIKQWKKWTNVIDNLVTEQTHYSLNPPWQLVLQKSDDIYRDFFVEVWLKRSSTRRKT